MNRKYKDIKYLIIKYYNEYDKNIDGKKFA